MQIKAEAKKYGFVLKDDFEQEVTSLYNKLRGGERVFSRVNKTIKELVNEILSKSKRKTIIVIQSDEGPFLPKGYFRDEKYLENIGNDPYVVHGKIFNAFYFPNKDADGIVDYSSLKINDSSTPVNTFRFIFNYYFGTNLKILQDKSFVYQDVNHPYKFIDVTKRVK